MRLLAVASFLLVAAAGPVAGQAQRAPAFDARITALLDRPTGKATTVLPRRPQDANGAGVVRCAYFPGFTIKELDYGEHGDSAISRTPAAGASRPHCGKQDDPGETLLADGPDSYFLGAKAGYVFLTSTSGGDGLGEMFIYDGQTGKRLLKGLWTTQSPLGVSVENGALALRVEAGATSDCSIVTGGAPCWAQFGRALPATLADQPAPVAACQAAYRSREPSAEAKNPSVVYYGVTMTLDKAGHTSPATYGTLRCGAQE